MKTDTLIKDIKKFFIENRTLLIIFFILSILTYGYFGVNSIINLDGINDFMIKNSISNSELYLSVGRWSWALVGSIFQYYPSFFLCLFINAFFFSISGVYFTKIFSVKSTFYNAILGALIITFPYNINAYSYAAWQFSLGLGMFLSIFTIYKIQNVKNTKSSLLPIFTFAFTVGLYQSFLPLMAVLAVLISIKALVDIKNYKSFFKTILRYLIIFILGCIVYYMITKITTLIFNVEMNAYQDARNMFDFNIVVFKEFFTDVFKSCFTIRVTNLFPLWNHVILISLCLMTLVMYYFKVGIKKVPLLLFMSFILILTPRLLVFFKPYVDHHTITLMPYIMFFTGIMAMLFSSVEFFKNIYVKTLGKISSILLIIIVSSFFINANKAGVMAKEITESSFHYMNRLQMRIEMLDGYNELPREKKYLIVNGLVIGGYPESDYAYYNELGITWGPANSHRDIIDSFNLLGVKVVDAKEVYEEEYYKEALNYADELIFENKTYPHKESMFIYNDIVVVVFKPISEQQREINEDRNK